MPYGKLYCVGIGPGDPELITVKAVKILRSADVIAVPETENGVSAAYKIAGQYIKGKEILHCILQMSKDYLALERNYSLIAGNIEDILKSGKTVAFITLGDPSIYSTCMKIHSIVSSHGYDTVLIPGVPSFCAAAASLNTSLCDRDQMLLILPANYERALDLLDFPANKVLMKSGASVLKIRDMLLNRGKLKNSRMAECCGMENEKTYDWKALKNLKGPTNYFSTILIKEGKHE